MDIKPIVAYRYQRLVIRDIRPSVMDGPGHRIVRASSTGDHYYFLEFSITEDEYKEHEGLALYVGKTITLMEYLDGSAWKVRCITDRARE